MQLWNQYCFRRGLVADSIKHRRDCPWADKVAPQARDLNDIFVEAYMKKLEATRLRLHTHTRNETISWLSTPQPCAS
jgi:hypothetical protein